MARVNLKKNKIVAIVQARCGSIRLPNKIMKKIDGIPSIELLYNRLKLSKELDHIVIATSKNQGNKKLINFCEKNNINYFLGSENNVLKRYFDASKVFKADIIVRITGDSILIDPKLVDRIIKIFKKSKVDYVSNCEPPTFPDGLDVEVFSKKC